MTNATILVVEDECVNARIIECQLTKLGYSIAAIVSSGEDAVRAAAEYNPDLILMDIQLEGAMDGIEAAGLIRNASHVPIIYLTASTDDHTIDRAGSTEAHGYLQKPIQERELHSMLQIALNKAWMESKIREERQWLVGTLRLVSDAVIAADPSGAVKFVNRAAEELTGWSEAEAIGRDLSEVFCERDSNTRQSVECILMHVLHAGSTSEVPYRRLLISRAGAETTVDGVASSILNENNQFTGVVLVFRSDS